MRLYYCWITGLIAAYQDGTVAGLAKKGYMVGPASKEGEIVAPGYSASALIALSVYKTDVEITASKIHEDVTTVLKQMKAHYFSIVVAESSDSCWTGSNFNIPSLEKGPDPSKKSTMN